MIHLTENTIEPLEVLAAVQSPLAGAVVLFLGTTRQFTDGRQTVQLSYDCYLGMAESQLTELKNAAMENWQLTACCIVHRLGDVGIGQVSVAVAVSSVHRQAAFAAGEWLMDQIKISVPIWKQEHWTDGRRDWIHPQNEPPPSSEDRIHVE